METILILWLTIVNLLTLCSYCLLAVECHLCLCHILFYWQLNHSSNHNVQPHHFVLNIFTKTCWELWCKLIGRRSFLQTFLDRVKGNHVHHLKREITHLLLQRYFSCATILLSPDFFDNKSLNSLLFFLDNRLQNTNKST